MKTTYSFRRMGRRAVFRLILIGAWLEVLLGPGCAPPLEESRHVQLILSTGELEPATQFEIRFDQAVVPAAKVGQRVDLSPLFIQPPVRGEFIWLSQRSGLFRPAEPLALGTAYRLRLHQDFQRAAGRPLSARLHKTVRTPGLEVFLVQENRRGGAKSRRDPEMKLVFNADIQPGAAIPFLEFRDGAGRRVVAKADWISWGGAEDQPTPKPTEWLSWAEKFHQAVRAPGSPEAISTGTNQAAQIRNVLVVRPEKLLPVGKDWVLVVRKGLPAALGGVCLDKERSFQLGSVVPVEVKEVSAHNSLDDGRRIAIRFSRALDRALKGQEFARWISVSPEPENLALVSWSTGVEINGQFPLGRAYTVLVRAGLPAEESLELEQNYTNTVEFAPLSPRLYFPQLDTHQMTWGRRTFDLRAINATSVRVQARQMDRHTLVHALRGYESYVKANDQVHDYWEPYQAVDFRAVPGRMIYDRTFDLPERTDEPQPVELAWDEILGKDRPGAVFLMAEQEVTRDGKRVRQGAQALVQVTDLGLAWKETTNQILVHIFSHRTGLPVTNATLRLLAPDNEALAEGVTDADGLVQVPGATNGMWLLAENGADLHAVRVDRQRMGLYNFRIPYQWYGGDDSRRLLLFSDRPVYRPGENVHLKGLVRDWLKESLVIPAGIQGELRVRDPQGDLVLRTNLVVNAHGSFTHTFVLPEGVRGQYAADVDLGPQTEHYFFRVQDFQPNAFNVVLGSRPSYGPAGPIEIPLAAHYYMGAPVSRADVRWSLEGEDAGFRPTGFDDYLFSPEWLDSALGMNRSTFVLHREERYMGQSNLLVTIQMPLNAVVPQPRSGVLQVEFTDLNQQTVVSSAEFVQHSSDFYLGLRRPQRVVCEGEPVPLELIAVRADGTPLPEPITTQVRVRRVEYHTVRTVTAGGARSYVSEPEVTEVTTLPCNTCPVERFGIGWRVLSTNRPSPLVLGRPGQYLVEAHARDASDREVMTAMMLQVYGAARASWRYPNETQVDLVPDQEQYEPGQTATVLIKSPVSGRVLVTVERDQVLRRFVAELEGKSPAVRVPIQEGDAPNVFVSVLQLRGAQASPRQNKIPEFRLGYCQLRVVDPRTQLRIAVQPDAPEYRPGDYVEVIARVQNAGGQAVNGAEVTLYAVDEGILSLTGYEVPDPHAFFFQPRPLRVQVGITLPWLLPEDPEQLNFFNKGYIVGGGGRGHLRKDFLPCAFWQAELLTDEKGEVQGRFRAPDSLTRYRVVAVAHAEESCFGAGQSSFEVNKPLMLEPALPQFANVTDVLFARAVVHNRTDVAGQVEIRLELDDKATPLQRQADAAVLTRRLPVGKGESQTVEFPVTFVKAGLAKWTWTARLLDASDVADNTLDTPALRPVALRASGRGFQDAVQSSLKVGYITPLRREIYLGRTEAEQTNLLAEANPQLLEGQGTVTVLISNTRLSELAESVSQLLHYPYGCVEQTGSSLLPWIVLHRNRTLWPLLSITGPDEGKAVLAGIARLFSMQTQDGGLAYWPGHSESEFWGSAYGGVVLSLARREGLPVSEERYQRVLRYLSSRLRGTGETFGDFSARCLAAYALALGQAAEPAYHEVLFKRRAEISAENRALLALAILESNGPTNMAAELLREQDSGSPPSDDWYGCGARDTAIRLLAWLRYQPRDGTVDKLVMELMQTRKRAHWLSTQGNAWALHALTDYARRIETADKTMNATLQFAGQEVPFQVNPETPGFKQSFPISAQTATAPLHLVNPGKHLLFTQVTLESRSAHAPLAPENKGYLIQRTYQKLNQEGVPSPLEDLQVGDRILVTLRLQASQTAHFVVVDDPLPAIFEAVNPDFKSQDTGPVQLGKDNLETWLSDFRELRADRALFFRDHLAPGSYAIRYLVRVRAAGHVTAPPALAAEMYNPERCGLTDTMRLNSLSLE